MRAVLLGAFALIAGGCGSKSVEMNSPAFDSAAVAGKILDQFDVNKNSQLETVELADCESLQFLLRSADSDGSKSLSRDELVARFEKYKSVLGASVPVSVYVTMDNAKLSGARIVLEPEPFMAEFLKSATGETDANGRAAEWIVGDSNHYGITAGLYRIKVEKDGTPIAARFNTATKLGREIFTNGRAAEVEVTLNVSSR